MLDTRVINLIQEIEQNGWNSEKTDFKLEWWADTVLKFNSIWSPIDASFYLITKVDPQNSKFEERKLGEDVWAIDISNEFPFTESSFNNCWTLKELKTKTLEILDFSIASLCNEKTSYQKLRIIF